MTQGSFRSTPSTTASFQAANNFMCKACVQVDLPLLTAERQKRPNDARVAFYLGQTYELIGDVESALETYQERIDMGGWQQEVFRGPPETGAIPRLTSLSDE